MEHVAPAASMLVGAGQSLVWLKLALTPIEAIVRGTFWTFLSVKVSDGELLKPRGTFPKLWLPGDNVTGATPFPVKLIVWELPVVELSIMTMELAKVPIAVGLNDTVILHDLLLASVKAGVGHAPAGSITEKGALGCEMLLMASGTVPVFLSVTDFVVVVPTARFPKFGLVELKDAVCALSCAAKPKINKQAPTVTNRRIRKLIVHLGRP